MESKNHFEKKKPDEENIPEWISKEGQEPNKKKEQIMFKPKASKRIARETIKKYDEDLSMELAKKGLIHVFLQIEA